MECLRCRATNPQSAKFCGVCGACLERVFHACGTPNPAANRYCYECGSPVDLGAVAASALRAPAGYTPKHLAEEILTSQAALEGERKQVTVVFCDITESMPLAQNIGAEAMHKLLEGFFALALHEIHRYGGTINQFLGGLRHDIAQ